MPTARVSRTIAAPCEQLWQIVSDPYHLPRWWPRVTRVEDVADGAFTEVMKTRAGKTVRADFDVVRADEQSGTVVWEQRLDGTPFACVLSSSETELRVAPAAGVQGGGLAAPADAASDVTIEMRQELSGQAAPRIGGRALLPSMGRRMVRRAATKMIEEALDGLERISA
ncbi:MAG: Polyketide cyclase/dehydrase [Solirubrobacterales bacterium]|nr:Polyketide cyclase/dehydrase [Solirubrobacterales bacterium]